MSNSMYRLITLHQRIVEAIRFELKRLAPSAIRLFRLKKLRLAVSRRLKLSMRGDAG